MAKIPFIKPHPLTLIIEPEIINDPFYDDLSQLARSPHLKNILEIGSSSGGGSTEAFVKAIQSRIDRAKVSLYCMEVSTERCAKLKQTYQNDMFVKAYNVSSVASSDFPSAKVVTDFYYNTSTKLNNAKLKTILQWLAADLDYIRNSTKDINGILLIKEQNQIPFFDMVLIDGSEFTGQAELSYVIGASVIALDDTETYKCYQAMKELLSHPEYELITHNPNVRNGYAIFKKKGFALD